MSFPPQPESARHAANRILQGVGFIASLLEEEEEDAGADRRHLQEQRDVSGGFRPRNRLLEVLRLGADPAESHAKEEDEPLLRAELQPQRSGQVVLRDVSEQHLRAAAAREPARVAGEEVAALE